MPGRKLQIDVKGPVKGNETLIECNLYIDGRCCKIYMSQYSYESFLEDRVFIRDGKNVDSAEVLNTTNIFEEKI